ncbi:uracil-DNA glycosylase [Dermacoccaceae bacterium W4C1]
MTIPTPAPLDASELPADWREALGADWFDDFWGKQASDLHAQRREREIFPPDDQLFTAFHLTPFSDARVVILGQDPYHQPGDAHGLAFSVPFGVRKPPSVSKIHKELHADLGIEPPPHGNLEAWAREGVLLLNTALTVERGSPADTDSAGWWTFSDKVLRALSEGSDHTVFILWGGPARQKAPLLDADKHAVIESAHPAARPGAKLPFLGSRPFSRANEFLEKADRQPIDWSSINN